MSLAQRVQRYLCASAAGAGDDASVGGLRVSIRARDPSPLANYAVPERPAGFDLEAVRETFAIRMRIPRLEWVAEYAPELEDQARAAGFALELRAPVMTCEPGQRRDPPPVDGLEVVPLAPDAPDALVRELLTVQEEGFGAEAVSVGAEDVAYIRGVIGGAALGRIDGRSAGGATLNALRDGLGEVTGVATRAAFRRRGVAAALVAEVARQGFAAGAEALLLTPGDAGSQRVYARAGFVPALTMLHYRAA
jgi:ribosomal protein S18 acetylase RimI-like enzyme